MDRVEQLEAGLRAVQQQANAQALWGIAQMCGRALAGETVVYSEEATQRAAQSVRAMVEGRW